MCRGTCQHLVCNKSPGSPVHAIQHWCRWRSACTTAATPSETRTCRRCLKEKDNKRRRGRGRWSRRGRASWRRVAKEKEGETWARAPSCTQAHRCASAFWKRCNDWVEVERADSKLEYHPMYLKLHRKTHHHLQRRFKDTQACSY